MDFHLIACLLGEQARGKLHIRNVAVELNLLREIAAPRRIVAQQKFLTRGVDIISRTDQKVLLVDQAFAAEFEHHGARLAFAARERDDVLIGYLRKYDLL